MSSPTAVRQESTRQQVQKGQPAMEARQALAPHESAMTGKAASELIQQKLYQDPTQQVLSVAEEPATQGSGHNSQESQAQEWNDLHVQNPALHEISDVYNPANGFQEDSEPNVQTRHACMHGKSIS